MFLPAAASCLKSHDFIMMKRCYNYNCGYSQSHSYYNIIEQVLNTGIQIKLANDFRLLGVRACDFNLMVYVNRYNSGAQTCSTCVIIIL